jgi:hypothetical protein
MSRKSLIRDFKFGRHFPPVSSSGISSPIKRRITVRKTRNILIHSNAIHSKMCLCRRPELEIWDSRVKSTKIDFLISPDFQEEFKLRLADENITFAVTIQDLQTSINGENPPDNGDSDNRQGNCGSIIQKNRFIIQRVLPNLA